MKFEKIVKNEELLKRISELNYTEPTEIQAKIIPLIFDGVDVLGQSQTGTGKTLAFALPILESVIENKKVQALILAPTRELAIQIEREINSIAKYLNIRTTCVYGSSSIENQIKELKRGVEIVVGTPGRVKDLINRKVLNLSDISFFVLDEADEMLSMGFQEELEYIFEKINNDRQVLLFSATMPKGIKLIAEKYMSPEYEVVSIKAEEKTAVNVEQEYYLVNSNTRLEVLCRLIDSYNPKKCIIFCKTKKNADEVLEKLSLRGYSADIIHGDIIQSQRIATLDHFKAGLFNYLIATDVAARGIHVNDIDVVINYNFPESNEAYVHRIGRTGRVNNKGLAITLINSREEKSLQELERYIQKDINKKSVPERDSIMVNRSQSVIDNANKYKNANYIDPLFKSFIANLSDDEKSSLINELLMEKLTKSIGSNFDVIISEEKTKKKRLKNRELNDSTRVFLTIGKLDKIEKREFLSFLEKKADVKEGTFTGVEILPKFTFLNVNNKYLDKVMKSCNNIRYNDRLIRIEKAKK
ncbi:MAG: DEAD/DEAH box helicase [Bacilli bacterium]|nr:DEAD/DEAH box helicase [Bacilli bacterium]MDD4733318.1 DEAD/DEAH box helicase [Bacilli bacterium]